MSMTEKEIEYIMTQPGYEGRTRVDVWEDGEEYVSSWEGKEVRAGNPFGLDSKLSDIGAPLPRNLFLVEVPR